MEIPARLRRELAQRAEYRCEHCLIPERCAGFDHQVDHVISKKHGGSHAVDNLAFCCVLRNRHKGPDIGSLDGQGNFVRFFNPRTDQWADHFVLSRPVIEPRTPEGEVTARVLRLNDARRVMERRLLQQLGAYPRSLV